MEKTKLKTLSIAAAVIIALTALVCLFFAPYGNNEAFSGEKVLTEDSYGLSFSYMNGTDEHRLQLIAGDILDCEWSVSSGRADLVIVDSHGTVLYRGNDLDTASMKLEIALEGEYTISVKARKAAGSISIEKE